MNCDDLTAFAEGELNGGDAASFRLHLAECSTCQHDLEETLQLQHLVAQTPRKLPSRAKHGAALALAAGLAFAFVALQPQDDFTARSGESSGKTAWIRVFVKHGQDVSPLGDHIRAKDGLLFAYTNLRDSDRSYLFIAGRDAKGRVHWYHPAYQSAGESPSSIAIERGAADRKLAEVVFADHAPGKLEICAVFTKTPVAVAELDKTLEAGADWPKDEPRDCHVVEVQR